MDEGQRKVEEDFHGVASHTSCKQVHRNQILRLSFLMLIYTHHRLLTRSHHGIDYKISLKNNNNKNKRGKTVQAAFLTAIH